METKELNINEVAFLINMLTSPKYLIETRNMVYRQYKACKELCDCFTSTEDIYLNREKFEELEMLKSIKEKLKTNE